MELCQARRGEMVKLEYLSPERIELIYRIPLAEVVRDFFDQLKSRSQGYASLDYEFDGYERSELVKVDVLLNGVAADAFSAIVHRDRAYDYGRRMTEKLRELIPRQMFDVPIQAAVGGRIVARETVKAKRKDVLAKCYGGDITRKRKLLEKQKEGKKKDEEHRPRRGAPGGLHLRSPSGRVGGASRAPGLALGSLDCQPRNDAGRTQGRHPPGRRGGVHRDRAAGRFSARRPRPGGAGLLGDGSQRHGGPRAGGVPAATPHLGGPGAH